MRTQSLFITTSALALLVIVALLGMSQAAATPSLAASVTCEECDEVCEKECLPDDQFCHAVCSYHCRDCGGDGVCCSEV